MVLEPAAAAAPPPTHCADTSPVNGLIHEVVELNVTVLVTGWATVCSAPAVVFQMICPDANGGAVVVVAGKIPPGATVNTRRSVMFPAIMLLADGATVTAPRSRDAVGVAGCPAPGDPEMISTSAYDDADPRS